jgi:hypothetical protein
MFSAIGTFLPVEWCYRPEGYADSASTDRTRSHALTNRDHSALVGRTPQSPRASGLTTIDAIVYRSRTTPESSLNYAFFGDDGFDVESWPLAERTDVLTDLVLHHGFTVNWDIDVD